MSVVAVIVVALALGALLGHRLAARGLTAANALLGRQALAYAILIAVGAAGFLLYRAPQLAWMPTVAAVYGEPAALHGARALAAFALALLLTLEWPGRRDLRRLRQLLGGGVALALLAGYLAYRALPLRIRLDSWVEDGVVMQTTAYTCAPASIATLVRWFGGDTTATEASVAYLAGTTREGTSTFHELRVMRRLGLRPRYARFLTPDSLAAASEPGAVLHVNERLASGATIRHAVALLEVDRIARTVLVGNPLHGRQVKRFVELEGYWTGEAIFIGGAGLTAAVGRDRHRR